MLLKTGQCFTNELELNANRVVIANTFNDCNGDPHVPGVQLAKCSDIPAIPADQQLSISGNTISLTNGGSVVLPPATVTPDFATPVETIAGTAANLIVNPADLYARENVPAQTGLSNDVTAIPAPAANDSVWGQNALGETLHYAPGLGWKIVSNMFSRVVTTLPDDPALSGTAFIPDTFVAPRDGLLSLGFWGMGISNGSNNSHVTPSIRQNGVVVAHTVSHQGLTTERMSATVHATVPVIAGDVFTFQGDWINSTSGFEANRTQIVYVG